MKILGKAGFHSDSEAALLDDDCFAAAAQEERFRHRKQDARFPRHAVQWCLHRAGLSATEFDFFVFHDRSLVKFDGLLETCIAHAPGGLRSFLVAIPVWLKEKLFLRSLLREELATSGRCDESELPALLITERHQSRAASVFFPSASSERLATSEGVGG